MADIAAVMMSAEFHLAPGGLDYILFVLFVKQIRFIPERRTANIGHQRTEMKLAMLGGCL